MTLGYFPSICASNLVAFDEVVALINNVHSPEDARRRAEGLVAAGEISSFAFVADYIGAAVAKATISRRSMRHRPYLLDYGLVMPHVVKTDWLLGWDAETRLLEPADWVTPGLDLLRTHPEVFQVSLTWPQPLGDSELAGETFSSIGQYALNWGFSDQLFLVRRTDLADASYRAFAPAALVRHAPHPYTFEFRMESHQRASRRCRATLTTHRYYTNALETGVIERTGRTLGDRLVFRTLRALEYYIVNRVPTSMGPRFSKR